MANIPAYMRIRQHVVDMVIRHATVDMPLMSERELCAKFDVARSTARKALKELVDEGVLYAKQGKGMFVNASMWRNHPAKLRRFHKIMVLCGGGRSIYIDGFHMDFLARLFDRFRSMPVMLQTLTFIGPIDQTFEELEMYSPDGVIWVRPFTSVAEVLAAARRKIPVCVVGKLPDGDPFSVTVDYRQAGRLAAAWFLDRGLNQPFFVGHDHESAVKSSLFQGWLEEFAARGLVFGERPRIDMEGDIVGRLKESLGKKPDGIFVFASELASVDAALAEAGVKDCPVVMDGPPGYLSRLTSIRPAAWLDMFPAAVAELAAENMFRRLEEPDFEPGETVIPPTLDNISDTKT